MVWVGHVTYRVLVVKSEGKRVFRKPAFIPTLAVVKSCYHRVADPSLWV